MVDFQKVRCVTKLAFNQAPVIDPRLFIGLRNKYNILDGKSAWKRSLGSSTYGRDDNIKMTLK
jgi:hypothetical protein